MRLIVLTVLIASTVGARFPPPLLLAGNSPMPPGTLSSLPPPQPWSLPRPKPFPSPPGPSKGSDSDRDTTQTLPPATGGPPGPGRPLPPATGDPPSPGPDKRKKLHFLLESIGVPVLGVLVFMAITILIFFLYRRTFNKRAHNTKDVEMFLKNSGSLNTKRYKYSELKKMTNSFKEKIGQGGYGSVFKGKLPNGCLVAVKVLTESKGSGQEFINEVASIGKTYHVNVVSLLGFSFQGSKRALIYEYMPMDLWRSTYMVIHQDKYIL